MVYPAHLGVTALVVIAVLLWAALIIAAARSGLFSRSGEDVKYKVFDDEDEQTERSANGRPAG